MDLLWPALSRGHSEECKKSPEDIIIVELVSSPLPLLHLLPVPRIVNVVAPTQHKTIKNRGKQANQENVTEKLLTIVQLYQNFPVFSVLLKYNSWIYF